MEEGQKRKRRKRSILGTPSKSRDREFDRLSSPLKRSRSRSMSIRAKAKKDSKKAKNRIQSGANYKLPLDTLDEDDVRQNLNFYFRFTFCKTKKTNY